MWEIHGGEMMMLDGCASFHRTGMNGSAHAQLEPREAIDGLIKINIIAKKTVFDTILLSQLPCMNKRIYHFDATISPKSKRVGLPVHFFLAF